MTAAAAEASPRPPLPRGDETVLLVDDDEQVRRALGLLLKNLGYQARIACGAEEALTLLDDDVDIMVNDIVMPGMDGVQLGQVARERRPTLPVVFISGYTDRTIPDLDGSRFLRKPFAIQELASVVREALDASHVA